jgi:hypothetical protein
VHGAGPVGRPRTRYVRWAAVLCTTVGVIAASGCAQKPGPVAVPTFSSPPSTSMKPVAHETDRGLPLDCEEFVGRDEIAALFGLPLDSVSVRTVLGRPAPLVGRLERVDCVYTLTPGAGPNRAGVVLRMTVGRYADGVAARDQHERNVVDQRTGASGSTRPELGAAAATMVRRGGENVLLTRYGALTLDLDVPDRPHPLDPVDLLTDLARRVLARIVPGPPSTGAGDRP